ncbi:ribosomal protein S18 acetylase RimI-like enzyme [Clostridium acetobutylicum]|uniref:Predicted acetyltransferase n=1 Tax=Clostridium acetobutylicum (strain ATCC 824 / DSM 792 / JCM 1419 / IAM 19013 / LMG 5710 / NBRC 13948 / NRRL B-527 / VKM B-1787 / 2291 / W) TaxID=272562 RepID=Q97FI6_CLOAB|nr:MULTISPECIES: GNAT family N-acetyltransferase [Clostridium]AAK80697.1 Predicted acetyltransferase [Clostridium acetobutylicum ATCC 824]ADZ21797.1 acetyltransferase [Clostridium acetobutylicum EA 2018]AEI32531.1 acetyltransferase [Clostridium acetobutylicum DSM 1731]AWV78890.1 GNAT family N-acetyltransferase [Clostridium acetobutylicum]MBC2395127.1 GNAT family N-acetyltransferase [Clostridium acetobutylicum]
MEFKRASKSDINNIMNIIKQSQEYFKQKGIDQWQNNYPNFEVIKEDIEKEDSFILLKDSRIVATAVISFSGDKNYDNIYEGKWLSYSSFAVIHRIAVDSNCKGEGLASVIIKEAEKLCLNKDVHSIKVDTHKNNLSMQKLLKKNGFKYCGIIYLEDKSERLAFEKLL